MDLSPDTLRQVEFREQWRGYHQDEVDDFLERVAVAVGALQEQLASAVDRAAQAEARLLESTSSEDELRRTLVLAQRTAEAARREAEEEAASTLERARDEAERLVRDAGEQARAVDEEARGRARAEVESLVKARDALAADVDALRGYLEEQRTRLRADAERLLQDLDRPGVLAAPEPPAVSDIDVAVSDAEVHVDPAEEEPLDTGTAEPDDGAGEEPLDDDLGGAPVDEPTAAHPAPAAFDDADDHDDTGEIAAAAADAAREAEEQREREHAMEHDPFLAELRRAVTDTEPLGPRDDHDDDAGAENEIVELYDQDLAPSSRFRLRRRR